MQGPIYSRGPFDAQPQIPGGGRESLQTNTNKAKFKEKAYYVSLPYVKTEGHCFILISFEIGKIGEKFSTFDAEISELMRDLSFPDFSGNFTHSHWKFVKILKSKVNQ